MTLYVHESLEPFFAKQNLFEQIMDLPGEISRKRDGRVTKRTMINGREYFIKQYSKFRWKQIFKMLFSLRIPILDASKEWRAINYLQQLGVDVPRIVAYDNRPATNPRLKQSFIMLESLNDRTITVEKFALSWRLSPVSFALKTAIIKKIAHIAKILHDHEILHNDFYLHHLLIDVSTGNHLVPEAIRIYLIDFHQTHMKKKLKECDRVKDLAGVYSSGKNIGFTTRDMLRFIKAYRNLPLRWILQYEREFWQKVLKRGQAIYQMECEKKAQRILSQQLDYRPA